MEQVSVDLFEFEKETFLIAVCNYSSYCYVKNLRKAQTFKAVKTSLTRWFNHVGYPSIIRSDKGPAFGPVFSNWCAQHGIRHTLSSSYNSRSNSIAERQIQEIRKIFSKCSLTGQDREVVLAEYRLAPRLSSESPSVMFHRRVPRSGFCPAIPRYISPGETQRWHATRPRSRRPPEEPPGITLPLLPLVQQSGSRTSVIQGSFGRFRAG